MALMILSAWALASLFLCASVIFGVWFFIVLRGKPTGSSAFLFAFLCGATFMGSIATMELTELFKLSGMLP